MHHSTSISPGRWLALTGKIGALMVALVLMSSSWAVAGVCHTCEGGGGGGGASGCGDLGTSTTFGQEPQISGNPKVGYSSSFSKLNANPDPDDVNINLQSWHVGTSATWSATNASVGTSATYTPAADNDFKYLFAKYKVSRAIPSCSEIWITDGKFIAPGDALVPTVQPQISGATTVGSVLTTTTGTWTPAATTSVIHWRRNNIDIPGAVATTYTLTAADVGKTISVQVYAIRDGYYNGAFTTPGVVIPGNIATTVGVTGVPSATRFGVLRTGTATVSSANGVPTGAIRVMNGSTMLQQVNLVNGTAAVTLPRLRVGSYTLTYAYVPASGSPHVGSNLVQTHTVIQARTRSTHKWRKAPTRKKAGVLRVYVTSPDAGKVTGGVVRVKVGKKVYLKTVTNGYTDIKIGKLKKGKRKFTSSYLGSRSYLKSATTTFTLRVK